MKRVWQHPEEAKTGRRYWRSIGELEQREDFLKNLGREFPNGDELSEEERENSRRTFHTPRVWSGWFPASRCFMRRPCLVLSV